MNLTYKLCEMLIEKGNYGSKGEMLLKLDVFYANNRLTSEEYETLIGLLNEE